MHNNNSDSPYCATPVDFGGRESYDDYVGDDDNLDIDTDDDMLLANKTIRCPDCKGSGRDCLDGVSIPCYCCGGTGKIVCDNEE